MPSILFLNRVYPPDSGATGIGIRRVARTFLDAGWSVTVVAAGHGESEKETPGGEVRVVRCSGGAPGRTLFHRALSYGLLFPRLLATVLTLPAHDVVVTMTDPPMLFLLGPLIRLIKGSRIIHWAQDIYPDIASASGIVNARGIIFRLLHFLAVASLKAHDRVVAVGECMLERLVRAGIPASGLRLVPNVWAGEGIQPVSREGAARDAAGFSGAFTVMYSGNFGRAHEFETILDAAAILLERCGDAVLFLFTGDGPRSEFLRREVSRRRLSNVRFLPPVAESGLSESLGLGDLHLVTMRPEMCGLVVPSKFYGIMAAGRPCLFVGPAGSEIAREILDGGLGERIEPGDSRNLASVILKFRDHPDLYGKTVAAVDSYRGRHGGLSGLPEIAAELLQGDRP